MTMEEAICLSKKQIDDAADRFHSVYHPCFHPIFVTHESLNSTPWLEAVVRHLQKREMPFVNAGEWLAFNDARRSLNIRDVSLAEEATTISFTVQAPHAVDNLTLLVPATFRGRNASLENLTGCQSSVLRIFHGVKQVGLILSLNPG